MGYIDPCDHAQSIEMAGQIVRIVEIGHCIGIGPGTVPVNARNELVEERLVDVWVTKGHFQASLCNVGRVLSSSNN